MYLEISNRQSGKSTRLINQIYADKDKYQLQILMGINFISLQIIKKQIKKNNKVKICSSFEAVKNIISESGKDISKIRLYVDEFMFSNSFCNNFDNFEKYFKQLLINGYFSSSINSNRNNILLNLSQLNDGGYFQVVRFPKNYCCF